MVYFIIILSAFMLNLTAIRLPFGLHLGSDIPSSRVDLTCAVFSYIRRLLWLPMLGIFDVHTDVDARDCMLKYEHREQRAGPDAQSTELHPRPESANKTEKCC